MDFKFNCPSCAYEILSLERYKGEKITCPNCKDEVLVPGVSDIRESDRLRIPEKEPTGIEIATERIRSELRSIKFALFIIMIGVLALAFIALVYYLDYCKVKEALKESLTKTSSSYRY